MAKLRRRLRVDSLELIGMKIVDARMYDEMFSHWVSWNDRGNLKNIRYPGVYVIAISRSHIAGLPFSWTRTIKYVGMTCSPSGIKGRLRQFDNTIIGKRGHGGADRFIYKHSDQTALKKKLYVSVVPFECDAAAAKPADLRTLGEVVKFEYLCLAEYRELFGKLPEFNRRTSPKASRARREQ